MSSGADFFGEEQRMSGSATFGGTRYQGGVIVFVYAHILAQHPLGWLSPIADIPAGVSGETGGIGDDVRIELGTGAPAIEVQAKHGLTAGVALADLMRGASGRDTPGNQAAMVLAVNRASSRAVYLELAQDLKRRRVGREEPLRKVTSDLLRDVPEADALLGRCYPVAVDVDSPADPERKHAWSLLTQVLVDASQTEAAYGVLESDAQSLCADRLYRTRTDLVAILAAAGIAVKPLAPADQWLGRLDHTRGLVDRQFNEAALWELRAIEAELGASRVDGLVWHHLYRQRASAYLKLGKPEDAERWARKAIPFAPHLAAAHQHLALALLAQGRLDEAAEAALEAVRRSPDDEAGWIAMANVAAGRGEPSPNPPPAIRQSVRYRFTRVLIAAQQGHWGEVHTVSGTLLAESECPPEVFVLRAQGIAVTSEVADLGAWADVLHLTTEALERFSNESHPMTPQALRLRSAAKAHLGDQEGESADLDLAKRLAPDELGIIDQIASGHIQRGQIAEALQVLAHPVVDTSSALLAQRARLLSDTDAERARADLSRAVDALPHEIDLPAGHLRIAEAAIVLGQLDLAKRMLDHVTTDSAHHKFFSGLLRARLLAEMGELEAAAIHYREAVDVQPSARAELFVELAARFGEAKLFDKVVATLEHVDEADLSDRGRSMLVAALLEEGRVVQAETLLGRLIDLDGELPEWGILASIELARKQDNPSVAIAGLSLLSERTAHDVPLRVELARQLLLNHMEAAATPHVNWLLSQSELTPREQMFVAQALMHLGREPEAILSGVRALRRSPVDPELHRALITLSLGARETPRVPEAIGPDTHVVLRDAQGAVRRYTIWAAGPRDLLRHEVSPDEATVLGLTGRTVGERVVLHPGDFRESEFEVVEILTAEAFLIGDTIANYEERFPTEKPFLKKVAIGDEASPAGFAGVFAIAARRATFVKFILEKYRDACLPLGLLANRLNTSVADLLATLGSEPDGPGVVFAQWEDLESRDRSLQAARDATALVLAPTAACTLHDLGLLDLVLGSYTVLLAESAWREIASLADEAESQARDGRRQIGVGANGMPFVTEIVGGTDGLVRRAAHLRALVTSLQAVTRRPRPLESLGAPGSPDELQRSMVGPASSDSMRLARSEGVPLCADDLGLRILAREHDKGRSVCSMDLLHALAESGAIDRDQYQASLVKLASRRYAFVVPKPATLAWAAARMSELGGASVRLVLEGLLHSHVSLGAAAIVIAQAAREVALAEVQVVSPAFIVAEGFSVLKERWPPGALAPPIRRACEQLLGLLPAILDEVEEAIAASAVGGERK